MSCAASTSPDRNQCRQTRYEFIFHDNQMLFGVTVPWSHAGQKVPVKPIFRLRGCYSRAATVAPSSIVYMTDNDTAADALDGAGAGADAGTAATATGVIGGGGGLAGGGGGGCGDGGGGAASGMVPPSELLNKPTAAGKFCSGGSRTAHFMCIAAQHTLRQPRALKEIEPVSFMPTTFTRTGAGQMLQIRGCAHWVAAAGSGTRRGRGPR